MVPLDYSGDGLRYAREMGVHDPVQGDIRTLPFRDDAFDLAFSMDVIVHLPPGEEQLAAREFARVLRPGGLVVVRCSALDLLRSRHGRVRPRAPALHTPAAGGSVRRPQASACCAAVTPTRC